MNTLSGPMFEPAKSGVWESTHNKQGAHYNTFGCRDDDGMTGLREMFPEGEANELNFVLFSTSGVHGMYTTIEEVESAEEDEEGYKPDSVTFLIVHPRIVCLRYGNCKPETPDDFAFLKKLRETSWAAMVKVGLDESNVDLTNRANQENQNTSTETEHSEVSTGDVLDGKTLAIVRLPLKTVPMIKIMDAMAEEYGPDNVRMSTEKGTHIRFFLSNVDLTNRADLKQ